MTLNSFSKIYIAPLQRTYSGEFPPHPGEGGQSLGQYTTGPLIRALGIRRSATGGSFQIGGPATEKARCCIIEVHRPRIRSSACLAWREPGPGHSRSSRKRPHQQGSTKPRQRSGKQSAAEKGTSMYYSE